MICTSMERSKHGARSASSFDQFKAKATSLRQIDLCSGLRLPKEVHTPVQSIYRLHHIGLETIAAYFRSPYRRKASASWRRLNPVTGNRILPNDLPVWTLCLRVRMPRAEVDAANHYTRILWVRRWAETMTSPFAAPAGLWCEYRTSGEIGPRR